ncbi:MAG: peptidylprolyl isomerase [Dehalococcoidia bacterium]|nr:peptidylprolyl isomerase [Dehalococcoidia bacterium]
MATDQPTSPEGDVADAPLVPVGRRRQAERRRRFRAGRVAIVAGLLSLILALVIPATGYYVVFVRPHQETALIVNETRYSWGDYLTRTRMVIAQAQATGAFQLETLNNLIFDMLAEIERQEIVAQFASQEGITASEEEVDFKVRSQILGATLAQDDSYPESEYQERYRRRLALLGISESTFRDVAEAEVLREKLELSLKASLPTTLSQRYLLVIQLSDIESARTAVARIDSGEDFGAVAREMSRDIQTQESGGDLGWVPPGVREAFDAVMFELEPDTVSQPLYGQSGVFVIKAVGEPEVREVEDRHVSRLESQALNAWLLQRREELVEIGRLSLPTGGVSSYRYAWVLKQINQDRELFPRRSASG